MYKLYHDIKVSAALMIREHSLGSKEYQGIDAFYCFATEFLLQESQRVYANLEEFRNAATRADKNHEVSEFAESFANDFDRVVTTYRASNDEALYIMAGQNGTLPLFSSLTNRSELDGAAYSVPRPFDTMRVLPHATPTSGTSLGFLSNNPELKVPNPALPPTEITRQIFHPNWFWVPTNTWLKPKSSIGFVPLVDETVAAISEESKGRVYYEQVGVKELLGANNNESVKTEEKHTSKQDAIVIDEDDFTQQNGLEEKANSNGKAKTPLKIGVHNINVKNLIEWRPGRVFQEDEIEAFEKGEAQNFVSRLLIDLNKLRFERYVSGNLKSGKDFDKVSKPSSKEKAIYFKVRRLLEILVSQLKPKDLVDMSDGEDSKGLKLSKLIPVQSMNYPGTLQAPLPMQHGMARYNRLTSLQPRGPYKKRK